MRTHSYVCVVLSRWGQHAFLFLWLFPTKWGSQVRLPGHTAQWVYLTFLDYCKQRLMGPNYYCCFLSDRVIRPVSCGQPLQDSWGILQCKDWNSASYPGIR